MELPFMALCLLLTRVQLTMDGSIFDKAIPQFGNLGTLTSWNPLGHSRPATGLIYLFA